MRQPTRLYLAGLTPAISLLSIFFLGPALWAVYASFTNMALVGPDAVNIHFVGIRNYTRLFRDDAFLQSFGNSLIFVIGSAIIGQFFLGLAIALLLDYAERAKMSGTNLVYGAVLLAWVNPTLISGFLWTAMFDFYYGTLNTLGHSLGFSPVNWLGNQAMLSVIVANTWRGAAFAMMVFLSGLKTIPQEIYEAARMDGAPSWARFRDMTIPHLRSIGLLVLLNITIATFGAFALILTLTNGGPGLKTEVISLYAYHTAFKSYEIGYGSAVSVAMLIINLVFAVGYLRALRSRTAAA
ncbi:MAG: sugar ABC transporter permease [Herpetosiphon sp.]